MSNFVSRLLTAVVAIPLLGLLVLWKERWGFGALAILCSAIGMHEFTTMMLPKSSRLQRWVIIALGTSLTVSWYLRPAFALPALLAVLISVSLAVLASPGDLPQAGARLGLAGFGILYVGGLTAALGLLHKELPEGPRWVLVALATTFANDTGAYFAGSQFGRHKLYPAVSPGKTIEGAFGGLIAAVAVLFLVRATLFPALRVVDCLLVALPASVLGPTGDLVESMLKRSGASRIRDV